jgi:hypothetical protein
MHRQRRRVVVLLAPRCCAGFRRLSDPDAKNNSCRDVPLGRTALRDISRRCLTRPYLTRDPSPTPPPHSLIRPLAGLRAALISAGMSLPTFRAHTCMWAVGWLVRRPPLARSVQSRSMSPTRLDPFPSTLLVPWQRARLSTTTTTHSQAQSACRHACVLLGAAHIDALGVVAEQGKRGPGRW